MKKTVVRHGYIDLADLTEWERLIESFAGQKVTITVETVEPEKPILRCNTIGCAKPAKWWILHDGFGPCKRCGDHLQDCLLDKPHDYHIKPIPPQPPEPPKPVVVLVERYEDFGRQMSCFPQFFGKPVTIQIEERVA